MSIQTKTDDQQLQADYNKARTEVDHLLKQLTEKLERHTEKVAEIHYGHVGDLKHIAAKLKELI